MSDHLHSFMSIVHSDGLGQFQQDNATPHASRVATKWLQEHSSDFRHFHWPPKSPEMDIIEDIRDDLLHAVEKKSPPPRTPMDLLTALQDSWCEFPPGYLQTPVESMPRRFASLLRASGAPHHQTNEYSLIFCGMLLCRLTPPLCLNFLGLIHLDSHVTKNSNIEETSYTKIMGHMDVIPIISDGFNIYFPILIFFVCLATYFNICSRILHFIGFEQFIGDDEMTSDLIEEGRELVKREKNRRQRVENRELRRRQSGRPTSSSLSRTNRRSGAREMSMTSSSPEENSRLELLKDVEPIDYTEERNHSPEEFGRPLHHEEYMGEDGNTYLRSSWSRIGRPPAGIFDDV
ncbi:LMBR1 domain-containing protein 2 [Araneus ventricosus]|uniref:LMBR1 domain-containing protein 2 n=1 Tax=Araneus ventricosus TaxID=182803 RepID=A0A4Y2K169_ARAVE|nr:LMBR1 domain-containing protein 2 [Araneus ventricosus]